jgi:hypothetical protein
VSGGEPPHHFSRRFRSMQIIEFNGLGQPCDPRFGSGTIALLVQGARVSVVRVEVLPPDSYGPSLEHALNEMELVHAASQTVHDAFPRGLDASRHWLLVCPPEIAVRARFRGDALA